MFKKEFDSREFLIVFLFSLIIIVFFIGLLTVKGNNLFIRNEIEEKTFIQSCVEKTETHEVQGTSMSGFIEQGEEIKLLYGYYECNEIKRNDVVAINYAGSDIPLIKFAKGLPKDNFYLQEEEGYWNLYINNEIVVNSNNEPYLINEQGYRMLSLYVNDFNNVIPSNTYLVLGNLISGSTDSTRFGLIDITSILGKVEKN